MSYSYDRRASERLSPKELEDLMTDADTVARQGESEANWPAAIRSYADSVRSEHESINTVAANLTEEQREQLADALDAHAKTFDRPTYYTVRGKGATWHASTEGDASLCGKIKRLPDTRETPPRQTVTCPACKRKVKELGIHQDPEQD
jgi:hypothetical protein